MSPLCRYSALTQSHARHGIYQNPGDSRSPADLEPVFLKYNISDIKINNLKSQEKKNFLNGFLNGITRMQSQ